MLVPCFMSWNKYPQNFPRLFHKHFVYEFVYIPVSEYLSFAKIIHPPGISRSWLNNMIITQVPLVLGTIKGHSKMCSFVTQHNATDVSCFEGTCNWHGDCSNVRHSCCRIIKCSFLYHKPAPTLFHRIWHYVQSASQPQTTCNHASQELHIWLLHLRDHLIPATRTTDETQKYFCL